MQRSVCTRKMANANDDGDDLFQKPHRFAFTQFGSRLYLHDFIQQSERKKHTAHCTRRCSDIVFLRQNETETKTTSTVENRIWLSGRTSGERASECCVYAFFFVVAQSKKSGGRQSVSKKALLNRVQAYS